MVTATGMATEVGRISGMLQTEETVTVEITVIPASSSSSTSQLLW